MLYDGRSFWGSFSGENMAVLHGWYSSRVAGITGTDIWRTPGGEDVEVTHVTDRKKQKPRTQDVEYVGTVLKRIGEGRSGG